MTLLPETSTAGGAAIPVVDPVTGVGGFPILLTLPPDERTADERVLADLLAGEHVLMLTTAEGAMLTSRPITLAEIDRSVLRFVVDTDASWIASVHSGAPVNASLADGSHGRWASITGTPAS